MKPWLAYLLGGFIGQLVEGRKKKAEEKIFNKRKELAYKLSKVDSFDIPPCEKEALKRDIKRRYKDEDGICIEHDEK